MGVLLEAFYKRGDMGVPSSVDGDSWWDHLAKQANELRRAGFTAAWLAPATKGAKGKGPDAVGYDVFDDYDLGSKNQKGAVATLYGTREHLARCVGIMRANGLDVYLDLVEHQRVGGSGPHHHTFRYADADGNIGGGRFPKESPNFYPGSSDEAYMQGGPSFGADLKIVRDPTRYVFNNLVDNVDWITRALDVQGYRIDDVTGLSTDFLFPFLNSKAMATKFAVGEFWDTNVKNIETWLFGQNTMKGRCSAFDFPLQSVLRRMCNRLDPFDMSELDHPGLAGSSPFNAVTFVENHDTDSNGKDTIVRNKMLAYAYILTSEGYPCVFYKDYSNDQFCYGLKQFIDKLLFIHEKIADGPTQRRFPTQPGLERSDVFVYERTGGQHLLVGLNNDEANAKTITVDTGFGPNVSLHDYTGQSADVQTDGDGRATIKIPQNVDGLGYVCYSRQGVDGGSSVQGHTVTQAFEGAQDLDIRPADNTHFVEAARVWCDQGTPIRGSLRFGIKDWTDASTITLQLIDPTGEMLASATFIRTTPQGASITATAKMTGFYVFQIRSAATPETNTKPPYTLDATYQAPTVLI
jgi:alpha-amylase